MAQARGDGPKGPDRRPVLGAARHDALPDAVDDDRVREAPGHVRGALEERPRDPPPGGRVHKGQEEDGEDIPFNNQNLKDMMEDAYWLRAVSDSYTKSLIDEKVKN